MTKTITLDDLRGHLENAKGKLAHEKSDILNLHPLPDDFSREEYGFAYVRAERLGMKAINRRLQDISWLPMQLDPQSEMMADNRASMKRWMTSPMLRRPDADDFGNDFIHSLARCGLTLGWDTHDFFKLSARVAHLFRDLSCLRGVIYYCTWLGENNVDSLPLSNPSDIMRTAEEITLLIQSPDIYQRLKAEEQDEGQAPCVKKDEVKKRETAKRAAKKKTPVFHVIENKGFVDPFEPSPVA